MSAADRSTTPTEWQAANGEVATSHAPRDHETSAVPVVGQRSVTAALPSSTDDARADLFDTVVLPVVPPRPRPAANAAREDPHGPRARQLGEHRRRSAPLALRSTVVLLFLLFLATSGALVALQVRPSAFDALRQSNVAPSTSQPRIPRPPATTAASQVALVSTTSSAITYSVPASSYSIVVTISHPCWLVVRSPAGNSVPVLEKTVEPALSPLNVPVRGSASIMIEARATSLSIVRGSTVLDTVKDPHLGIEYYFVPTST